MLAAQLHERRQWIVAPERMDIRPDPHVKRRVALDGSLRISIAVDEGLVGEDGEVETFEPVRSVDHLPQHLAGIHHPRGAVIQAVYDGCPGSLQPPGDGVEREPWNAGTT